MPTLKLLTRGIIPLSPHRLPVRSKFAKSCSQFSMLFGQAHR